MSCLREAMNCSCCDWPAPPSTLRLGHGEVHLWGLSLDRIYSGTGPLEMMLSKTELEKANRYLFEKDRRRCVVARATLKVLLGRYLSLNPADIEFWSNEYGKPYIVLEGQSTNIQFNLSHSGYLILFAFVRNYKIGIDVEQIRDIKDMDNMVNKCFSHVEKKVYFGLSSDHKKVAFFRCWTRKESYIKAHGLGLSFPLAAFSVQYGQGSLACLLEDSRDDPSKWSLKEIRTCQNYLAALSVRGVDLTYCYYDALHLLP